MEDIAHLGLMISSDGVATASSRMRAFSDEAKGAERAAKGLESAAGLVTKAMGLLGAALSVQQLIRMTSVWTDLNSRVRNAIDAHENAAMVMERINQMARLTYSSLEQTAEGFLLNSKALSELGYSTSEALDFVESLNNALVVSGAKGERAASVMNALSKAIGIGKLGGDDLNTVLATGGRVAEALADGLGVSTLQLRKLGAEGKLTTDQVVKALTSQLEKLRKEAEDMPATIEDGFTQISRALTVGVGRLDEYLGASSAVADGMIWLSNNIDVLIPIIGALAGVIAASLIPVLISATAAMVAFAASPIGLLTIGLGALAGAAAYFWNEGRKADQAARDMASAIDQNARALKDGRDESGRYSKALRDQVAMQVEAAEASLKMADAATNAARVAAVAQRINLLGMTFSNPFADADAAAKLQTSMIMDKQLIELQAQLTKIDAAGTFSPAKIKPDDPGQEKARKGYDELVKSTQRRTEALQAEAAALGMTAVQAESFTNLQELMAAAEKTGIEMTEPRIQQIIRLSDSLTDANLTLEGLHITLANQSPWDAMVDRVEFLDQLLKEKRIGWTEYAAEVGKAVEDMVGKYASAATGVLGQAQNLSDALYDIEKQRIENSGLAGDELTAALDQQAQKQFETNKQISLANAVIAGGEAIVKSYNWGTTLGGPVGGALAAGLAAAATAAQIAAIAGSTYQSKTMPAAATSGGGGATAAPPQASKNIIINLQGNANTPTTQGAVKSLMDQLNEELGNEGKQFVTRYIGE